MRSCVAVVGVVVVVLLLLCCCFASCCCCCFLCVWAMTVRVLFLFQLGRYYSMTRIELGDAVYHNVFTFAVLSQLGDAVVFGSVLTFRFLLFSR